MSRFIEPVYQGPLTKKVLLECVEGVYVMSAVTDELGAPLVSQTVPERAHRSEFWAELKQLGVAGRTVYMFKSAAEYALFLSENPIADGPPGSPFPRNAPRMR